MTRAPRALIAAATVSALLVLAGCGGGGGGSNVVRYKQPAGPSTENIKIDAGNFYYNPNKVTASPGIATLTLESQGGLHTLVFDKGKFPGFLLEVSGSGDTNSLKVDLKPGTYVFYCDIAGHRQQGMEGTLTVS